MSFLLTLALTLSAPVYSYMGDGVLKRSGSFHYTPDDPAYRIIYCIANPPRVTLDCVMHTPDDKLVLIKVIATEQGS
jgi:hypothetical protein